MIYNDLDEIIKNIQNKYIEMYCVLEKRPPKYMFGVNNYGDIQNTLNIADNDPWDVVVTGYKPLKLYQKYKITSIEGILYLKNGNHKLFVNIDCEEERKSLKNCINEMFIYRRLYNKVCKKYGHIQILK